MEIFMDIETQRVSITFSQVHKSVCLHMEMCMYIRRGCWECAERFHFEAYVFLLCFLGFILWWTYPIMKENWYPKSSVSDVSGVNAHHSQSKLAAFPLLPFSPLKPITVLQFSESPCQVQSWASMSTHLTGLLSQLLHMVCHRQAKTLGTKVQTI